MKQKKIVKKKNKKNLTEFQKNLNQFYFKPMINKLENFRKS